MGLFSSILEKLGFGHTASATPNTTSAAATPAASPAVPASTAPAPVAVAVVDVVARLDALAAMVGW